MATAIQLSTMEAKIVSLQGDVASLRKDNASIREEVASVQKDNALILEEVVSVRKDNALIREEVASVWNAVKELTAFVRNGFESMRQEMKTDDISTLARRVGKEFGMQLVAANA